MRGSSSDFQLDHSAPAARTPPVAQINAYMHSQLSRGQLKMTDGRPTRSRLGLVRR